MKIAVVCSGLGHVQRGIEAWAKALAEGLHREGQDVVLFHGASEDRGPATTDYGPRTTGVGRPTADHGPRTIGPGTTNNQEPATNNQQPSRLFRCPNIALRFAKRGDAFVRRLVRIAPGFTWRWGWKSAYAFEQRSFARALLPHLRSGGFDVVHTQDPVVADMLERARRRGRLRVPTILGHGTNEDVAYLSRFRYLQHISPEHERASRDKLGPQALQFMIPNFIDTRPFSSAAASGPAPLWKAPPSSVVVGCAGVLASTIKRMDTLVPEVAAVRQIDPRVHLFVAGATTNETPSIERSAREQLGDAAHILHDVPFAEMPAFYRSLDVFVLPCCVETFGIAAVEAMASGVPVVAHDSPTLRWVVGPGGWLRDVNSSGYLAAMWRDVEAERVERGRRAREHVLANFSWEAVRARYLGMYEAVVADARCGVA